MVPYRPLASLHHRTVALLHHRNMLRLPTVARSHHRTRFPLPACLQAYSGSADAEAGLFVMEYELHGEPCCCAVLCSGLAAGLG